MNKTYLLNGWSQHCDGHLFGRIYATREQALAALAADKQCAQGSSIPLTQGAAYGVTDRRHVYEPTAMQRMIWRWA